MRLVACLTLSLLLAAQAAAQTLRWSSQGDLQTLDPHSQNEILTNSLNGQIYEGLARRLPDQSVVPNLATEWTRTSPTTWRLKLRAGVKFHDGTPFTADDVVFSMQRLRDAYSPFRAYASAVGIPRAIDPLTVEFVQDKPTPIFVELLPGLFIMSKRWAEEHKITRPLNYKAKEESYASLNANGTGPFMLVKREPGTRTSYKRNPAWWNKFQGNLQEFVYLPIGNDATRLAALLSGEIDFLLDPAPRDVTRLRQTPGFKVMEGPENRMIFIGMDQARDKLLYGKVPGDTNPFKDLRVRRAMYQAIDIEAIRAKLMNGLSHPSGGFTPSPIGAYHDAALETRLPFDLAAARKLMQEAGYPDGFEVTLDCPNNRYVNDEEICIALASMWSQLKLKVKVNAQPRALVFPKLENLDTSLYLFGWGGGANDAEVMFSQILRKRGADGIGYANYGQWGYDKADQLAVASALEVNPDKRQPLVKAALQAYRELLPILPLHRQVTLWVMRQGVTPVHAANNWLALDLVTVNPRP
ncbi:ABC transporter substrate-binding protein [Pelomonas sp. SE-A7]|uniref:ABC transporter substrate-binding protein n=1 Tax=Pelomonas sp. SE-A7 TaxID=3054953 RepID=UPI00259CBED6|nr:ABC transporter substrate-binding protein [Pelomonas sp. SE-A7]MDM4765478.1 ABC transporter substrate-binding protein [Pelomonas sp. SE-A7]